MGANRSYKDSVFSFFFNDPETLREFYGALEGVALPPDVPITINTLESVLFMERVNDIFFAVADKLVLVLEHQSTVKRCKKLEGYSEFIGKAREYEKELGNREEGVKAAVKDCISRGILKEFLELHSSEVFNMLFTEWNWGDALAVRFEEGREGIARNALMEGFSVETIQKITGLDIETIRNISQ
jgi:hypothetical protein